MRHHHLQRYSQQYGQRPLGQLIRYDPSVFPSPCLLPLRRHVRRPHLPGLPGNHACELLIGPAVRRSDTGQRVDGYRLLAPGIPLVRVWLSRTAGRVVDSPGHPRRCPRRSGHRPGQRHRRHQPFQLRGHRVEPPRQRRRAPRFHPGQPVGHGRQRRAGRPSLYLRGPDSQFQTQQGYVAWPYRIRRCLSAVLFTAAQGRQLCGHLRRPADNRGEYCRLFCPGSVRPWPWQLCSHHRLPISAFPAHNPSRHHKVRLLIRWAPGTVENILHIADGYTTGPDACGDCARRGQ